MKEPAKVPLNLPHGIYTNFVRNCDLYYVFSLGNWFFYIVIGCIVFIPVSLILNDVDESTQYLISMMAGLFVMSYFGGMLAIWNMVYKCELLKLFPGTSPRLGGFEYSNSEKTTSGIKACFVAAMISVPIMSFLFLWFKLVI